jgi:3-polyprenyl-4-hydroxybenzoate decarboxylase
VSHITKRIVVVDDDVNVHDLNDVEWAIWTRVAAAGKFRVIPDVESWELERCAKDGKGSLRLAVDATMDMEDREKLQRPVIPGADQVKLADYLSRKTAA